MIDIGFAMRSLYSEIAEDFAKKRCTIVCISTINLEQLLQTVDLPVITGNGLMNITAKTLREEHLKVTRNKPRKNLALKILFSFAVIKDVWQSILKRTAGTERVLEICNEPHWQAGSLYCACLHYVCLRCTSHKILKQDLI